MHASARRIRIETRKQKRHGLFVSSFQDGTTSSRQLDLVPIQGDSFDIE